MTAPIGYRIQRFHKLTGKFEFDITDYGPEPSPDFLANMARTWRVEVTKLYAGPVSSVPIHIDLEQSARTANFIAVQEDMRGEA